MTTYIFLDDALRMLVKAFLMSGVLILAASGIGLAVIETIEKTGVSVDAKRLPGG